MAITREEVLAAGFDLSLRDCQTMAEVLSIGRVKVVPCEIGKGKIISTLGLLNGNVLLDTIDNSTEFRHIKHLLANGWLDVGDTLTRQMIDQICTVPVATALKALAEVPDIVTAQEVAELLYNPDGSLK